jgi:dephospho-CoA kinase
MPLIIGVTGAIATGKTTVCQLLVRHGATHCDADSLVHRLYDPGTPGFERVIAAFGPELVGTNGYIDRKVLGAKVFGNPTEMKRLTEAIGSITDAIRAVVDDWRRELSGDDVAVLEAVNMIEPGYSAWLDQTWLVACDIEDMRQRLAARNQLSSTQVEQRLASQRPWLDRAPAADAVFLNDGSIHDLVAAVDREFERVIALHRCGELAQSQWHAWSRQVGVLPPS